MDGVDVEEAVVIGIKLVEQDSEKKICIIMLLLWATADGLIRSSGDLVKCQ